MSETEKRLTADGIVSECGKIARKHAEKRQRYDKEYSEAELSASAQTAAEIADEIEAMEDAFTLPSPPAPAEPCPLPEKWRERANEPEYKLHREWAIDQCADELDSWLSQQGAAPAPVGLTGQALDRLAADMELDESEIEKLTAALQKIAELPLGHHDAKRIALTALQAPADTAGKEG